MKLRQAHKIMNSQRDMGHKGGTVMAAHHTLARRSRRAWFKAGRSRKITVLGYQRPDSPAERAALMATIRKALGQ